MIGVPLISMGIPGADGALLMAALGEPVIPTSPGIGSDLLVQTAAGLILLGILLFWAKYLRGKKRKRIRKRRQGSRRSSISDTKPIEVDDPVDATEQDTETEHGHQAFSEGEAPATTRRHHRRRRPRRQHRPRNPTLAETGGLPPRRDPGHPPSVH